MNVPLKKRYNNYPAISNRGATSTISILNTRDPAVSAGGHDAVTVTLSNALAQQRNNNNVKKQDTQSFEKLPDKITNSTPTIMPISSSIMQGTQLPQNRIHGSGDILKFSARTVPPILPATAISLKTSTSSAAANTSSSSIKSGAQSENGDDSILSNNANLYLPIRETLRHQNKHLNEANVKISEYENPAMTTNDRVMNWMIAEEFSDLEDDIDLDDTKFISAFRSERLQIKSYQKNHPIMTKRQSRTKTISSNHSSLTNTAKKSKCVIYKPFKLFFNEEQYKPPSLDNSNCSDSTPVEMHNISQKRGYPDDAHTNLACLPKKRTLYRQMSNDAIPTQTIGDEVDDDDNERLDASIQLRIDYAKSRTDKVSHFKIPRAPVARTVHSHYPPMRLANFDRLSEIDHRMSPSSLREATVHTASRNQEEFYKYLGIDTNPCQGKQSPESATESRSSSNRRRSLRVKIQQKVVKSIEKSNETAKDDPTQKASNRSIGRNERLDDSASTISNGHQYVDVTEQMNKGDNYILPERHQEPAVTARIDIRYSYQKQNGPAKRPEIFRSQDCTNRSAPQVPTIKTEVDAPVTLAAIVDRRFYEPIDSETSARTYPFLHSGPVVDPVDDKSAVLNAISNLSNKRLGDRSAVVIVDLTSDHEDDLEESINNNERTKNTSNNMSNNSDRSNKHAADNHSRTQLINGVHDGDVVNKPSTLTAIDVMHKKPTSQPTASTSSLSRNGVQQNATGNKRKLHARKKPSLQEWVKHYEKSLQKSALLKLLLQKKERKRKFEKMIVFRNNLLASKATASNRVTPPEAVPSTSFTSSEAGLTPIAPFGGIQSTPVAPEKANPSTSTLQTQAIPSESARPMETISSASTAPARNSPTAASDQMIDDDPVYADLPILSSIIADVVPRERLERILPSLVRSTEPAPTMIDPEPPQTLLQASSNSFVDDPQPSTSAAHDKRITNSSQEYLSHANDEYLDVAEGDLSSPLHSPMSTGQSLNPFQEKHFSTITHSSTSTDSAIGLAINAQFEKLVKARTEPALPTTSLKMPSSNMQETNSTAPDQTLSVGKNPLRPEHGAVLAALVVTTHNHNEIIVAVQELSVSFWKMAPKFFNIFGITQSCELMGRVGRSTTDKEIVVPYQNRIIVGFDKLPVYVEFRGRELHNNDSRECWLTSVHANIYFLSDTDPERLSFQSIQLDTIKSPIDCITYVTIPNTMFVAMAWTERFLINKKRATVCKYGLCYPELDALNSITDFVPIQDTINSLSCVADHKLVGYGGKSFTMWDHRTGDLLINLDLNAHIGINLGCFMLENVDYIFIIQFFKKTEATADEHSIKLIAISTESYKWQTLQLHKIPAHFDKITSTYISSDHLIVTFANGHSILMNLQLPQDIYICDAQADKNLRRRATLADGHKSLVISDGKSNGTCIVNQMDYQVFVCNGKILQVCKEYWITRSIMEHFISFNR